MTHPVEALFDAISKAGEDDRKRYHLTLGDLIDTLESGDPDALVSVDDGGGLTHPHSYRGFYSDLAFAPTDTPLTASELLAIAKPALGQTYTGWKGGEFRMERDTPLWLSNEGSASDLAIVGTADANGVTILVTKQLEF